MRNSHWPSNLAVLVVLFLDGAEFDGCLCDLVALGLCVSLDHDVSACADHCITILSNLEHGSLSLLNPAMASAMEIKCHTFLVPTTKAHLVHSAGPRPLREPGDSSSFPYTLLGCKRLCENPSGAMPSPSPDHHWSCPAQVIRLLLSDVYSH